MQCPRCSNRLASGAYESHDAHYCHKCSGTLFEQAALGKTLERLKVDLFEAIDPSLPIPPLPDVKGSANCPKCRAPMENYGYMGTKRVMLDACNSCQVVWVDPMELATMAQMLVRLDKNMDSFRQAHRPANIVSAAMSTMHVEKALLLALILS